MIKFYTQYKQIILEATLLIALMSAFAFPAEGFARNFLFGLAAGAAIVISLHGFSKSKKLNNEQSVQGSDTTKLN